MSGASSRLEYPDSGYSSLDEMKLARCREGRHVVEFVLSLGKASVSYLV